MIAGLWTHKETFDGTYSFEDLLDAHELLDLKEANEGRVREWEEANKGNV